MKMKLIYTIIFFSIITSCLYTPQLQKISMGQRGVYHDAIWSPDSEQLLVIFRPKKENDLQLYLYNLANHEWELLEVTDMSYSADWIDKETIVFERSSLDESGFALLKSALVFYNLKTQEQIQLDWGHSIGNIQKNPIHNELALQQEVYFNHYGIYTHNIDTHEEILIYSSSIREESVSDIAWSPNGKTIVFTLAKDNLYSLNLLDVSTGKSKVLVDYSDVTFERISWANNNLIIVREISENYVISVFSITPDGDKKYIDMYGITPVQVSFSSIDNIMLVTSLGSPGSNDIYLLFEEK